MSEDPETITAAEMAARMGMTPEELQREIGASRRPRVLVVPDPGPLGIAWKTHCEQCGDVGRGAREVSLTIAHQHNNDAHEGSGSVRALDD